MALEGYLDCCYYLSKPFNVDQALYVIIFVDPEHIMYLAYVWWILEPQKKDPNLLWLLKHVKLCLQINIVMEPNTLQGHDTAPIYTIIKASISQFYTFRDP